MRSDFSLKTVLLAEMLPLKIKVFTVLNFDEPLNSECKGGVVRAKKHERESMIYHQY